MILLKYVLKQKIALCSKFVMFILIVALLHVLFLIPTFFATPRNAFASTYQNEVHSLEIYFFFIFIFIICVLRLLSTPLQ